MFGKCIKFVGCAVGGIVAIPVTMFTCTVIYYSIIDLNRQKLREHDLFSNKQAMKIKEAYNIKEHDHDKIIDEYLKKYKTIQTHYNKKNEEIGDADNWLPF